MKHPGVGLMPDLDFRVEGAEPPEVVLPMPASPVPPDVLRKAN